jgi:hypothetical protein
MRHLLTGLAVGALAVVGCAEVASAQNRPAVPLNQRARIRQGVQDGSLTRTEAQRLRRQEKQLRRQVVRNRRDGGGLTPRENRRIRANTRQNSRMIARLRNNGRRR